MGYILTVATLSYAAGLLTSNFLPATSFLPAYTYKCLSATCCCFPVPTNILLPSYYSSYFPPADLLLSRFTFFYRLPLHPTCYFQFPTCYTYFSKLCNSRFESSTFYFLPYSSYLLLPPCSYFLLAIYRLLRKPLSH